MNNLRGLLGIRRMDRVLKGLIKVFSDGSAILKKWGMIGLLKGYMWEWLGSRLVGRPGKRGGLIPLRATWRIEVWMVYDRNECWGGEFICEGVMLGVWPRWWTPGFDERFSYVLVQLYEVIWGGGLSVTKNKGLRGNCLLLYLLLLFYHPSFLTWCLLTPLWCET